MYLVVLDQVAIRRLGDHVEISYPDDPAWRCHIYVGPAGATMTDQDILDLHNGILLDRAASALTRRGRWP